MPTLRLSTSVTTGPATYVTLKDRGTKRTKSITVYGLTPEQVIKVLQRAEKTDDLLVSSNRSTNPNVAAS